MEFKIKKFLYNLNIKYLIKSQFHKIHNLIEFY